MQTAESCYDYRFVNPRFGTKKVYWEGKLVEIHDLPNIHDFMTAVFEHAEGVEVVAHSLKGVAHRGVVEEYWPVIEPVMREFAAASPDRFDDLRTIAALRKQEEASGVRIVEADTHMRDYAGSRAYDELMPIVLRYPDFPPEILYT